MTAPWLWHVIVIELIGTARTMCKQLELWGRCVLPLDGSDAGYFAVSLSSGSVLVFLPEGYSTRKYAAN